MVQENFLQITRLDLHGLMDTIIVEGAKAVIGGTQLLSENISFRITLETAPKGDKKL